ncbi:MAG TPA: RND transporter, partial [Acidobacteriaceae bacterium]
MDISRPDIKKKKRRNQILWGSIAVVVVAVAAYLVTRLKPALTPVDKATIWTDTVKTAPLVVQVRGPGTLVPREDSIELIPAQTEATVVRIRVLPGAHVTPDTILMDLADPPLQQQLLSAEQALKGAKADLKSLQATLESALMDKKSAAAQVNSDYTQNQLAAQTDKQLFELGVKSGIEYNASKNKADATTAQHQISLQQIDMNTKAIEVQLASAQAKVDAAQTLYDLYKKQEAALQVRAGISGVLSTLPVPLQVGQHVTQGTSVAEVVQP